MEWQERLYDETEAIRRDLVKLGIMGIDPNGNVFNASEAFTLQLITYEELVEASIKYEKRMSCKEVKYGERTR